MKIAITGSSGLIGTALTSALNTKGHFVIPMVRGNQSQPDTIALIAGIPINPLALIMGAAQILQMKIVPTTADPAQQRMMMIISGSFIIFLYSMPSGLTLYWAANQILNVIQYRITHAYMNKKGIGVVQKAS